MPVNNRTEKPIVVIGSINYDILLQQERLPRIGETVLIEDVHRCGGGKGANQVVQVAKLGHRAVMVGAVGSDVFGDLLLEELSSYGVDTSCIMRKSPNSGLRIVNYITTGALLSNVYAGANNLITPSDIDCYKEIITGADLVIFQTEIPVETVEYGIQMAHDHGIRVVYNAAPVRPLRQSILGMIDVMIMNEAEAGYYFGEELNSPERALDLGIEFQKRYHNTIIVTLGPQGSVCIDSSQAFILNPIDVPVKETTGAGDSFVGALAVKMAEGADLGTACRFATAASSITIQKTGGQSAMPTLQEVSDLYTATYDT